ncbi:hypothetical protein HUT19_29670 [Streptomyces sp. NA02950]|nr:hypothetical protein HUT19_29670 [Streptomyces sp. NA02950]
MSTQGARAGRIAFVAGATRGAGRAMAVELGAAGATVSVTGRTTRERTRFGGRAVAALAADPDRARWNGQSVSSGELAKVYGFDDLDGSRPDAFGYFRDVVFGGKAGTAEDYR